MKDWTGNTKAIYSTLGASNHADHDRQDDDYYATEPVAVEMLLDLEKFSHDIWEPACGEGHISKVLESHGYSVKSSDLVDRGYGTVGDFLTTDEKWDGDIVTNPPYKYAQEFVEKSLATVGDGHKVAMFLKLQFLEGKARKELFRNNPPKTVWVSSSRLRCGMNGEFTGTSAVAYCWYIWEKGYHGDTIVKWFN